MLTMVNTDKVWAEPARFTARAFAAKGTPAYLYLFSYVSPSMRQRMRYGAAHASEIPYVFGTPHGRDGAAVDTQGPGSGQDDEHLLGKLRQDRRSQW